MRKEEFANEEFYHLFNRGVDKREIFSDAYDLSRFFQSMKEFNVVEPVGSIYENSFSKKKNLKKETGEKLIEFVCFCLNKNHYHFLVQQKVDKGIEKFMHRLGGGYTKYFNNKYQRSGSLFQGKFKARHINSNEYLLHVSAYVNLNNRVHQLGSSASKLMFSSLEEYVGKTENKEKIFCEKDVILGQFKTVDDYKKFAESSLEDILRRRNLKREEEKEEEKKEKEELVDLLLE